jgi:hypothetical protein
VEFVIRKIIKFIFGFQEYWFPTFSKGFPLSNFTCDFDDKGNLIREIWFPGIL